MSKLIVCIDGLGKDLVTKENMPFLTEFGKKNNFSTLKTLFAFTGLEYCFFTGKNPEKSKIWLEFSKSEKSIFGNFLLKLLYFNKKLRNYIGALLQLLAGRTYIAGTHNIPKNKLKEFDVSTKVGLWKLKYFQKNKFAFYKWPFFIEKEESEKTKIIFKYENDSQRLERLLSKEGLDIYYTQLMMADKALHKFGKESKKTKEVLRELDSYLKIGIDKFLEKNPKGEVYIWSDHGFCNVKNYIDIEKLLPKKEGYNYFIAGTTVSFWFEEEEIKKEILGLVKKDSRINILTEKLAKKYQIPFEKRNGELIFFVEKENYFFPNFYQKEQKERFVGMHGYPEDAELDGIFISNKKIPLKLNMDQAIKYI